MIEHIAIDDRRVDAAQVEQIEYVVEDAASHDRQDAHVVAVIDDAGELGGEL